MIRIIVEIAGDLSQFEAVSRSIEDAVTSYDLLLFRAEQVTKGWQVREV